MTITTLYGANHNGFTPLHNTLTAVNGYGWRDGWHEEQLAEGLSLFTHNDGSALVGLQASRALCTNLALLELKPCDIPRRKVLTPAQVEKARAICKHHGNKPCNGWVLTPTLINFAIASQGYALQFQPIGRVQTCPDEEI